MDLHLSSKDIGDSSKQFEEHIVARVLEITLLGNQENGSVKVASEKNKGVGKDNIGEHVTSLTNTTLF